MPPGGRAEIENVKHAKSDILNFNSATKWRYGTFTPPFPSVEQWNIAQKSTIQIFYTLSINKFH